MKVGKSNEGTGSLALVLAAILTLGNQATAQDLGSNLVVGGSVETRAVYEADTEGLQDDNASYRSELLHRGLWELRLDGNRFVLAHEAKASTTGKPELTVRQAYLSLGLGYLGRLDMGRQELALGLGSLFQPVDPLVDSQGRSTLEGLALILNPWANHGIKAVLALDGLWDGSNSFIDGAYSSTGGKLPLAEAWRGLLFGLRYDGLVGPWEPALAFFFRDAEFLRLGASSRLALGPAIVRLEGAWDLEEPYRYPLADASYPGGIDWRVREAGDDGLFGRFGGGGMGLVGVDLYLYPAGATLVVGTEYAYQSRGFERRERLLAQAWTEYLAGQEAAEELPASLQEGRLPTGQWDTRHRLGFHATVQPTDRISLSGLFVLGLDYPEGVAHSLAELGIELHRPENIDLFLQLRQGWAGKPWDGDRMSTTAMTGFRIHY